MFGLMIAKSDNPEATCERLLSAHATFWAEVATIPACYLCNAAATFQGPSEHGWMVRCGACMPVALEQNATQVDIGLALDALDGVNFVNTREWVKGLERDLIRAFTRTAERINYTQPFEGRKSQPAFCRGYFPRNGVKLATIPSVDAHQRVGWDYSRGCTAQVTSGVADASNAARDRWSNGVDDNNATSVAVIGSTY